MNLTWGVPLSEPAIMPAKTILSMATEKGQQCLGGQDGVDGFLKKGARADIVGIDRSRIYMAEYGKISNTIMESVNAGDIRDSVSGGRILMKDYEIQTLDEERILHDLRSYQERAESN